MASPAFVAAGSGQSTLGLSMAVPYPSRTIVAGDFLVLHVFDRNTAGITTPAGWTSIISNTGSTGLHHCYYKIATGTESAAGSLTVSFSFQSPGKGKYARIYHFTGGGGVEGTGAASSFSSTIADQSVTTTAGGRLAVNLVSLSDDLAIGSFTGMSGGTWAEATPEYTSTTDSHATLQIQTADMPSAGTINGGTVAVLTASPPGTKDFAVMGFAITPAPTMISVGVEADSAFPMTVVLGTPGLTHAMGLASTTDTALAMTAVQSGPDLELAVDVDFGSGFTPLGTHEIPGDSVTTVYGAGFYGDALYGGEADPVTTVGESRVRSVSITRGRPFNLDLVEAATADASFQNSDGFLDPSNAESPYYGHILPISPIRIYRRSDGITYSLLSGIVERWTPTWSPPNYQDVQITASDFFDTLSSQTIVSGFSSLTTAFGSNEDLVFTAIDAGENGDNITITYALTGASATLSVDTNDPLNGNAIVSGVWPTHKGVSFTPGGSMNAVGTGTAPIPLAVNISGSDITVNLATNGSTVSTSTASDVMALLASDDTAKSLVSVALATGSTGAGVVTAYGPVNLAGGKWPSELTGTRINRVLDLIGWDPTARNIDSGQLLVAEKGFALSDNESALSHIQEVADAELGAFFFAGDGTATFHDGAHRATSSRSTSVQAVFSDDGTGFSYVSISPSIDMDRIVNEATVTSSAANPVAQTVDDVFSQSGSGSPPAHATFVPARGFGKRSMQRQTQLADDLDALAQAQAIVDAFSYPLLRFDEITTFEETPTELFLFCSETLSCSESLEIESEGDNNWVQTVLGLEIGDLIEVRTTPPAVSTTTSFNAYVEQIVDNVTPGIPWARTLKLSPSSQSISGSGGDPSAMLNTIGGALILDDATNGVIG